MTGRSPVTLGPDSAERMKGCKKMSGRHPKNGSGTTVTISHAARKSRLFYRNSEQFRLLERLFNALRPQSFNLESGAGRIAMQRMLKAELVEASVKRKVHDCCSCPHVRYSITLAGRAHFVAAKLGLTFSQLCYLALARNASRNAMIEGAPGFVDSDVDSVHFTVLQDTLPSDTRKALTRKGFLAKRVCHASSLAPRFAELERYAAVVDELYLWVRKEYESRLLQAMQEPAIARLVSLLPQAAG